MCTVATWAGWPPGWAWGLAGVAGLAVTTWHRWRTDWAFPARLAAALVGLGCAGRTEDGAALEPRRVGRPVRAGATVTTRWRLPLGVTVAEVTAPADALGEHLDAGDSVWSDGASCVIRCARGRIPAHVSLSGFERTRPLGDGCWLGPGIGRVGPAWVDLATCPHVVVGGTTGGGKSVFLRQACTGLAGAYGPDRLRLALVDLKGGTELAPLGTWPHAWGPVADHLDAAADLLAGVRGELAWRLAALRIAGVSDVGALTVTNAGRPPWLRCLVVVDEMAEATCAAGGADRATRDAQQAVAGGLAALARLGRAAGVHLLLATQRPDAEAVPGQLKANCTGTLAFRVRTAANSWILLDGDRAAHLPQHPGRALWVTDTVTELQVPACDRAESEAWVGAGARARAQAPAALVRQRAQTASASSDGVVE
ncbi:MAG TPA: FtsK/SpoIIIE domain-containing protein [Verrucomicrobiae bacterium]|nr:FtsK/SpoIIIE domain-containing protein [Verrucomicrobiae bacterium]